MDNLDVICIGAAIVDIPLQPVSKNIFDVDSYPLERIAMTTGGDAINEATIISRLGHRTALMSRVGKDAAGQFILDHCRKENIDIQSLKQDVSIDTSINVGLVSMAVIPATAGTFIVMSPRLIKQPSLPVLITTVFTPHARKQSAISSSVSFPVSNFASAKLGNR